MFTSKQAKTTSNNTTSHTFQLRTLPQPNLFHVTELGSDLQCKVCVRGSPFPQPALFDATVLGSNLRCGVWVWLFSVATNSSVLCDGVGLGPLMRGLGCSPLPQPALFNVTGLGSDLWCEVWVWVFSFSTTNIVQCDRVGLKPSMWGLGMVFLLAWFNMTGLGWNLWYEVWVPWLPLMAWWQEAMTPTLGTSFVAASYWVP